MSALFIRERLFDFINSHYIIDNPGPSKEHQSLENELIISYFGKHENNMPRSQANANEDLSSVTDLNAADENQLCNFQSNVLKEGMWVIARFLSKPEDLFSVPRDVVAVLNEPTPGRRVLVKTQ